jgi:hypothetical protein
MGVTVTSASAQTYIPIATYTTVSGDKSVTFGAGGTLPQTYTDLVIVGQFGDASGNYNSLQVILNGDGSSSNYSFTRMNGNGSAAQSARYTAQPFGNVNQSIGATNDLNTNCIIHFFNYINQNTYKTFLYRANNPTGSYPGAEAGVNLWRSQNNITSIKLQNGGGSGNLVVNSTFTLYGIKAA